MNTDLGKETTCRRRGLKDHANDEDPLFLIFPSYITGLQRNACLGAATGFHLLGAKVLQCLCHGFR